MGVKLNKLYCLLNRVRKQEQTCSELAQEAKMSSDSMKNIVLDTSDGWIVIDWRITARDEWVAEVDFIHEDFCEKANAVIQKKKVINEFHLELGQPLKAITRTTGKDLNLNWQVCLKHIKIMVQAMGKGWNK